MNTNTTLADLETALDQKRSERQQSRPAPITPPSHDQLKAEHTKLQIPILQIINLGADFVGKMLVKFNIGRDHRDIPSGVKEFVHTMGSVGRMAANLEKGAEVAGEEVTEKNRFPGRKHDTALGILGGKRVDLLQIAAMTSLEKTGLTLRDVNVQRSSSGSYVVVFVYTRQPFADGIHFKHCDEKLARELEVRFSKATSRETTTFWNPDKSVTVNVGPYWAGKAEKVLVVAEDNGVPVLKIEEVTKQ
ncbi:MAG: hypothetical protein Q7S86_00060 [bacterium]|nr:hypothetical protein [bacterium]